MVAIFRQILRFFVYWWRVARWGGRSWWSAKRGIFTATAIALLLAAIGLSAHQLVIWRWPELVSTIGKPVTEALITVLYVGVPALCLGLVVFLVLLVFSPSQIYHEQQAKIRSLSFRPGRYDHLRSAVENLSRAYDYGSEPGAGIRRFWVAISELTKLGASNVDLRHLSDLGLIEYGDDITRANVDGVAIRKAFAFSQDTLISLTEPGRRWATETFGFDDDAHATNSA